MRPYCVQSRPMADWDDDLVARKIREWAWRTQPDIHALYRVCRIFNLAGLADELAAELRQARPGLGEMRQ